MNFVDESLFHGQAEFNYMDGVMRSEVSRFNTSRAATF